jgi:hypothetical protein
MELDWHAESLRVSLFTRVAPTLSDQDWKTLTGQEEADTRTQIPGGRAFIGSAFGGQLTLANPGLRIDCMLSVLPSEQPVGGTFNSVGPWSNTSETFLEATVPWITALDIEVTRVAFGCVLLLKSDSRDEAYARLGDLLSSVNVKSEMRDLIFRVNWVAKSKAVPDLQINRITSWAAVRISLGTLIVAGAAPAQVQLGPPADCVRLEIDHNTVQEWGKPFDREQVVSIYKELVSLADENAKKGEVQ